MDVHADLSFKSSFLRDCAFPAGIGWAAATGDKRRRDERDEQDEEKRFILAIPFILSARLLDAGQEKQADAMSVFVITGGAGFIGSHLAERCLLLGHHVIVVDDLTRGSRDNVAHLVDNPRFTAVEGSVCDRRELAKHVAKAFVVFHLAASPDTAADGGDWRTVLQRNYDATAAVLDVATRFAQEGRRGVVRGRVRRR